MFELFREVSRTSNGEPILHLRQPKITLPHLVPGLKVEQREKQTNFVR